MNFILQPSLFGQSSRVQLLRLFGAAVDRRHRVYIPEAADHAWKSWRATLDSPTAEQLDNALDWSVHENAERPSGVDLVVEDRPASAWSKWILTLDDAVDLAGLPFRIFLENAVSDGQFLRALLTEDERAWFDNMVAREWLVLETAGGIIELKKRVQWARASESRRLRVAALFDGDAVEPPQANESLEQLRKRLHPNSRAVLDACRSAQSGDSDAFPHHVTRRRSIENYLPIATLERWAKSVGARERDAVEKRVAALKGLERRHQFNMKDGHSGDRKRIPAVKWLPPATNTALEQGFGADIATVLPSASNGELKADGGFDEFRPFIHALRRRLS